MRFVVFISTFTRRGIDGMLRRVKPTSLDRELEVSAPIAETDRPQSVRSRAREAPNRPTCETTLRSTIHRREEAI